VDKENLPESINVYSYVLANLKRHKLRSFLTIFGLIICIVFFIIIASLSIGLYEPTESELPAEPETPEEKFKDPEIIELDQNVKQTIVNWLYATAVLIFATATAGVANTMLISMSERKRAARVML